MKYLAQCPANSKPCLNASHSQQLHIFTYSLLCFLSMFFKKVALIHIYFIFILGISQGSFQYSYRKQSKKKPQ